MLTFGDIDAERSVIASMARDQASLIDGLDQLEDKDFTNKRARTLFDYMRQMFEAGRGVDPTSLAAYARASGIEGVQVPEPSTADASLEEHINILKDRSLRRSVAKTYEKILAALRTEPNPTAIIEQLERESYAIRQHHGNGRRDRRSWSSEELADWFTTYVNREEGTEQDVFTYPLATLNERLGGFSRGELVVPAGYSADGKSVFALQQLQQACRAGLRVGYWSLEMPERQIQRRLVGMAGIPLHVLRDRTFDDGQYRIISDRLQELRTWQYDVYSGSSTTDQIRAEQVRQGYDVVIIDHLHRMPNSGDRLTLEGYVSGCKNIALDTDCSVIALAQLARREGFPPPTTNQLRGTDVLTQEADVVFFVYRDRDAGGKRIDRGSLIVAKVRDGEADFEIPIRFIPSHMSFEETHNV